MKTKRLLRSALHSWRFKPEAGSSVSGEIGKDISPLELEHQIPRGTMTGIRTVISVHGKMKAPTSQVMHSVVDEEYGDSWPLHHLSAEQEESTRAIKVQRDVTMIGEEM